jgi:hypothetical protein
MLNDNDISVIGGVGRKWHYRASGHRRPDADELVGNIRNPAGKRRVAGGGVALWDEYPVAAVTVWGVAADSVVPPGPLRSVGQRLHGYIVAKRKTKVISHDKKC